MRPPLMLAALGAACAPGVTSEALLVVAAGPPPAQTVWWRLRAPEYVSRHDLVRVPVPGGDRLFSTWTAPYAGGPKPAIVEVVLLSSGEVQYLPTPIMLAGEGRALAAGDLRGVRTTQLVLLTEDRLMIIDPRTWAVLSNVVVPLATSSSNAELALHDLNGDGRLEVLVRGEEEMAVVTPVGQVLGMVDLLGNDSGPWVGEVDGTPGLEVVLPESGTWLNGATLQVEGTSTGIAGVPQRLVDVDGDGVQEVLWMDDGTLGAHDLVTGDTQRVSPGGPWFSDVPDAVAEFDLDGDGSLELLVPRDQADRERTEVLDAATGTWLRDIEMTHPWAELFRAVPFDHDGDGDDELAWSGPSGVEILDPTAGTWLSAAPLLGQRPSAFSLGDVDGDGSGELVVGSGYYWNEIAVFDATTRQLVSYGMLDVTVEYEQPTPLTLLDVDGDGDDELLLGSGFGDAVLAQLSRTGPPVTIAFEEDRIYRTSGNLFVVDVDGDGDDEVVSSGTGRMRLWDPSGQLANWGVTGSANGGFAIGDVLGTGQRTIAWARTNGPLEVRGLLTGALLMTGPANYQKVLVEGPGVVWCFVRTTDGVVHLDRYTVAGTVFSLDRSLSVQRTELTGLMQVQWIDGRIWLLGGGASVLVDPVTGDQQLVQTSLISGGQGELQKVGGVVLIPDTTGWRAVRAN